MSVSGIRLGNPNYSAARNFSPLSEEELEQRRLNREIMSQLDFNGIKLSMGQGRQRFTEAHVAEHGLGPRPSALIPRTEAQQAQIMSILEELRSSTEEGSLRMSLIDRMLKEISTGIGPANGFA
jgi:hypothetical protein